jgi:hypothetical protein
MTDFRLLAAIEFLRRFGLAAACILVPFVVVHFGMDGPVGNLIPQEKVEKPPFTVSYTLRSDPKNNNEAKASLYARDLAGRYSYGVGVGFMYLLIALAVPFAGTIVYRRAGLPGLGIVAAGACLLAGYVSYNVVERPYARPLIIDGILLQADDYFAPKAPTATAPSTPCPVIDLPATRSWTIPGAHSTACMVDRIMVITSFIGVFAVGLMMGAVCLASVRSTRNDLEQDDLKRRRIEIQVAFVLTSAVLVVYVLISKMLLDWPLSLLADAQRPTFELISESVLFHWSAAATIVLLLIFIPALVAYLLDVAAYRARRRGDAETSASLPADGLEFARWSSGMANVVIALAPLLASPIANMLKAIIGAVPVK